MKNFVFQTSKGFNLTGSYFVFPTDDEYQLGNFLDIILIHAFPFDSSMYLPNFENEKMVEELNQFAATKGYIRIFLPNLPGFGQSDKFKEEPNNLLPYVYCIDEIVNKFNLSNIIIGGCSMGGYIALEYLRNHIKLLDGLILIDTKSTADTDEQKHNRFNTIETIKNSLKNDPGDYSIEIEQLYHNNKLIKEFIDNLHGNIVSEHITENNQQISREILNIMKQQNPNGIIHALRAMAGRNDNTKILKKFRKDVLIIVGGYDKITPIDISVQIKNLTRRSTLNIIPNAGHLSNMENFLEFNRVLIDWIKKIYSNRQ
ncbi:MAG: alpha/beta fold hydrolase [Candidatus Thorarchaeota archaeon]